MTEILPRRSNLVQESSATTTTATTTTTPSSPGPPKLPPKKPAKRIRISTACVNCRQKKIKCDGHAPCAHCEKFRTECIYPATTKPANQEYVETLENRLKSVESHLQGLLSRGWGKGVSAPLDNDHGDMIPDDADVNSPYTPSSIPATPPSKPSHNLNDIYSFTNSRRQSNGLPRHMSGVTSSNLCQTDSETDDSSLSPDDSMQVLSLLMGNLKVDRDGAAHYLPKVLDQKERSYNDSRSYGSSSPNSFSESTNLDWGSLEVPPSYTLPNSLLTPMAINALLEIYFNSVHTFLPVIHKTSFLTLCQDGNYRVPPFLLMSICSVAARHATEMELQDIPELSNLKSHHSLYDHARTLLDTYMDVPRISTIQGLLLLAYYQIKEKRSGHFFRIRMYINLATRMATDMGLQNTLFKSLSEIEASNTGDSLPNIASPHNRMMNPTLHSMSQYPSISNSRQNGTIKDQHARYSQEKLAVIHQENCLAWLGCFFLDGLTSSLMGQDYCVTNPTLDMPKLIQEAGQMSDTVQGATLIFWYHHLELVQIYRRICLFFRTISSEHTLTRAIKSPEMQSIETSLIGWLSKLPSHLVYIDNLGPEAPLPSYYTLYLHRFYYSHKLLLYRPLISNKTHRGELKDHNSSIAKCSHAATMLTQIGEIIFQNYSWPWPGCGLFAYHMLQAAEIHVFQMVTQSTVDSQNLYYRTMDLIKGYVSLAKLPELEKDVLTMEEMVSNFLLAPQDPLPHSTPQQQHFVNTPASDYSYASVMSPSSPTESVQRMTLNHNGHSNTQYNQQNHHNSDDTYMFSPLQSHAYPSLDSASRIFRQNQSQSQNSNMVSTVTTASGLVTGGLSTTDGFSSIGFDLPNVTSSVHANPLIYGGSSQSSLSFYDSNTTPPNHQQPTSQINMFESNGQNQSQGSNSYGLGEYSQPSFLQSTPLAPVGDLLGLGNMDNRGFTGSTSFSTPHHFSVSPNEHDSTVARRKSIVPPPKPPKRVLSQSTGSSSSSGISQSAKPPVPKKPSRLTDMGPPRWIAPRPDSQVIPAAVVSTHSGLASAINNSNNAGNGSMNGPTPNQGTVTNSISNGRTIKVMPQSSLYGMGTLVNTLGVEQQIHPMPDPNDHVSNRIHHGHSGDALNYLAMNDHLYDTLPNQNRRQVI
ncbi:hypothetical protein BGZ76_001388 [Entomortierella beljakovae]|nr:hypothetical protein BGZ76_001388 [Entomortierella beljakovae]